MLVDSLCRAIQTRNVVSFFYIGETIPGIRVVEPHMVAYTEDGNIALSGWLSAGTSASGGQGWRLYLLKSISNLTITEETFPGPRPGYNPTGGRKLHSVQCAL